MLEMALSAAAALVDPERLSFVALGVVIGLSIGVIPGLGGVVGLSLLLPFTFDMDPITALAFLVGLQAVVVTSDTIPAVLFGVPGTVGSAATILDGHPMARQGLAARAFGAAFSSSVLGGLLGALFLALAIPVLRPVILSFGSPELLAVCVFGLSLVGVLSGAARLKGLAAAAVGVVIATIGEEPNTAIERWTFGTLYLLDGIPLVPLALGLFAIPELADMAIARRSVSSDLQRTTRAGQLEGVKDTLRNYWLLIRGSGIGALLGAVPGIGASVIDWIAYGHALRTEKGASETFGKGDVRGVIASESSNNAKEGGALVSTIAFGVPATAGMALLLGAFLIHGISPGPDMLSTRLDVTYTLVWTIALANILGAGICFAFANQLASIARIRIGLLAPVVLSVVFIGAFQGSRQWGDIAVLLAFGLLGWLMKRVNWPRPPLLLGFVLGGLIERYMFISFQRYDAQWLTRPIVLVIFAITLIGILRPAFSRLMRGGFAMQRIEIKWQRASLGGDLAFSFLVLAFFAVAIAYASDWDFGARLVPEVVGGAGVLFVGLQLLAKMFVRSQATDKTGSAPAMDLEDSFADLTPAEVRHRALRYFGWCAFAFAAAVVIGLLPALFFFLLGYMLLESKERWPTALGVAMAASAAWYVLFHQLLRIPWPSTVLGDLLPMLRSSPLTNLL